MSTVLRIGEQGKSQTALPEREELDTRIALIQALLPLGLQAVEEVLQQEVQTLAGPRYARADGAPHLVRWGRQPGSVYLADQKLAIQGKTDARKEAVKGWNAAATGSYTSPSSSPSWRLR